MEPVARQAGQEATRLPHAAWVPFAAWAAFLALAFVARSLGAGVFTTALVALVPFGLGGALLERARHAVGLTLLIGLALLVLLPDVLAALGLKPGATVGAAAIGALALPLGSGLGHYRRHQRTARATSAVAAAKAMAPPTAKRAAGKLATAAPHAARRKAAATTRAAAGERPSPAASARKPRA